MNGGRGERGFRTMSTRGRAGVYKEKRIKSVYTVVDSDVFDEEANELL